MQDGIKAAWSRLKDTLTRKQPSCPSVDGESADQLLRSLGLSSWTRRVLIQHSVTSLEQLLELTPQALQEMKNLGPSSTAEIQRAIDKLRTQPPQEPGRLAQEIVAEPAAVYGPAAETPSDVSRGSEVASAIPMVSNGRPIQELNLHGSVENALKKAGIMTIEQLCSLSYREVKNLDGIGEQYARLVDWALTRSGLVLRTAPRTAQTETNCRPQAGSDAKPVLSVASATPASQVGSSSRSGTGVPFVSISELGLSTRSSHCLFRAGFRTVDQLVHLTEANLLRIRNLGVASAREILQKTSDYLQRTQQPQPDQDPLAPPVADNADVMTEPVAVLDLSTRPAGVLQRARVHTVGDLCARTAEQLMALDNFGRTSLDEVIRALGKRGLTLRGTHVTVGDLKRLSPQITQLPLADLGLGTRPMRVFERYNLRTVGDLCAKSASELLEFDSFGEGSLHEVVTALKRRGLGLRAEVTQAAEGPETASPVIEPATLAEWLAICLQRLDPRCQTVIRLRTGLEDGCDNTLDEVGRALGVSRERVRQLEKKAIHSLHHPSLRRLMHPLNAFYHEVIESGGGIVIEEQLEAAVRKRYDHAGVNPLSFVRFTLSLCRGVEDWGGGRWALATVGKASYRRVERRLVQQLEFVGHPLQDSHLLSEATDLGVDQGLIQACLRTSTKLQLAGEWVALQSWGREKAVWVVAALSTLGKPSHFTQVSLVMSEVAAHLGQMADHAVHSMLLRHPEVVRTGSGTFALRRWNVLGEVSAPPARKPASGVAEGDDPVEDVMRILFPEG